MLAHVCFSTNDFRSPKSSRSKNLSRRLGVARPVQIQGRKHSNLHALLLEVVTEATEGGVDLPDNLQVLRGHVDILELSAKETAESTENAVQETGDGVTSATGETLKGVTAENASDFVDKITHSTGSATGNVTDSRGGTATSVASSRGSTVRSVASGISGVSRSIAKTAELAAAEKSAQETVEDATLVAGAPTDRVEDIVWKGQLVCVRCR